MGAARARLGRPVEPATVEIRVVGQRSGRPLGVDWWLGSRRHLDTPRPELGLPLAVAAFMPMRLSSAAPKAINIRIRAERRAGQIEKTREKTKRSGANPGLGSVARRDRSSDPR